MATAFHIHPSLNVQQLFSIIANQMLHSIDVYLQQRRPHYEVAPQPAGYKTPVVGGFGVDWSFSGREALPKSHVISLQVSVRINL